jgi:hypothetical protein
MTEHLQAQTLGAIYDVKEDPWRVLQSGDRVHESVGLSADPLAPVSLSCRPGSSLVTVAPSYVLSREKGVPYTVNWIP